MWISDTSIKRPVFATMVIVSFMVLGIVSLGRLGIDLFPEVNFPFVNISVVYPGAGPEEVETLVTRPIEDAVAGINGVKRVISTSTEGFSRVGIELRLEIDPQAATAEVREKVAAIRERLPEQIKDPTIQRFDVSALPIATYAVGSTSLASDRIRRMVEDDLKPLLGQIDGVAAVEVNGGQVRELQVNLDPRRLEALNLPITEVAAKLAADNLDLPGGQVRRDGKAVSLRTQGQYKTASEIENVILRSDGGSTVRVKDVGDSRRRLRRSRLDDAPGWRGRGVVLGAQAVGRQLRRRAAQDRRGAREGGAELPRAADQDRPHRRGRHHRKRRRRADEHHLRRHHGRPRGVRVHARLALDADHRAGAADVGDRDVLLHVCGRLHHQHDDADGAVARDRHPDRRRGGGAREHLPPHGAR